MPKIDHKANGNENLWISDVNKLVTILQFKRYEVEVGSEKQTRVDDQPWCHQARSFTVMNQSMPLIRQMSETIVSANPPLSS